MDERLPSSIDCAFATGSSVFLTARWEHLLLVNYKVDPSLLRRFVPRGVELDQFNGAFYVSIVGFLFRQTRVLGMRAPFHTDFEEVNLRFYVRRKTDDGWRRAVVFIKEIVPRALIAFAARTFYNEPYVAWPMRHRLDLTDGGVRQGGLVNYEWCNTGRWEGISARARGPFQPLKPGSAEEFITEHYWGYTPQRNGTTKEYRVEHDRWPVCLATDVQLKCDVTRTYGSDFAPILSAPPCSAFIARGSPVVVHAGRLLPADAER